MLSAARPLREMRKKRTSSEVLPPPGQAITRREEDEQEHVHKQLGKTSFSNVVDCIHYSKCTFHEVSGFFHCEFLSGQGIYLVDESLNFVYGWPGSIVLKCADGRIQLDRRQRGGVAAPDRAQVSGQLLRVNVAGAGEGIDFSALLRRHLGENVSGSAKAIEADMFGCVVNHAIGAIADQAGA